MTRYITMILCALLFWGCAEDDYDYLSSNVPVGQPARVAIKYNVPAAPVMSRDMIEEDLASLVTSLWIGVFSQTDGHLTYSQVFRATPRDANDMQLVGQGEPLYIYPPSGSSIMVAVGNIDSNYGIHENTSDGAISTVADLLSGVRSLADYKDLAAVLLEPTQISKISGNLMMSGTYVTSDQPHDGSPHPEGLFSATDSPGKVDILPGNNVLQGYLRLCRHASYVKFNIRANPLVNLEMVDWQVLDIPALSLLAERNDLNGGDLPNGLTSNPRYPDHYNNSIVNNNFVKEGDANTFDFYIYGNRRTGTSAVNNYQDREKEYKNTDGTNTRVFTSLVTPDQYAASNLMTNNSPYVRVRMKASYWIDASNSEDLVDVNHQFAPVDPATHPNAVQRMGEFTSIIHLGYCDGNTEAEKARDFNVHRNYKYTYNVTVSGIDNIRVEAVSQSLERQPGLSGQVNDAMTAIVGLDAHYSAFNIKISNGQRAQIRYTLRSHFDGQIIEIEDKTRAQVLADNKEQFYDWIQFAPALGPDLLAAYPGTQNYPSSKLWSLDQLCDPEHYPGYKPVSGTITSSTTPTSAGYAPDKQAWEDEECWYTVFINENVYEKDVDGSTLTPGEWTKYVNNDGRSCALQVLESHTSADLESRYLHSIIYIQQKALWTFYSVMGEVAPDNVIGVEHDNETLGRNMVWTANNAGWAEKDGRYNEWRFKGNNNLTWTGTNNVLQVLVTADGSKWNPMEKTPNVSFSTFSQPAKDANLPALRPWTVESVDRSGVKNDYYPDPYDPHTYEALAVCLSRNRDLNGDGNIDANELRWVLPATDEMELIVIGTPAIPAKLIDYNNAIPSIPYTAWPKELKNGLVHYITSNCNMLWADQHMVYGLSGQVKYAPNKNNSFHSDATGNYYDDNQGNFWQMRCIRPITSNISATPTQPADGHRWYTRPLTVEARTPSTSNPAIGVLTTTYLNRACIADPVTSAIPYHSVRSVGINKSYRKFEFAEPVEITGVNSNADWVQLLANGNNPVAYLGQGWRVPTAQELMTLHRVSSVMTDHIQNQHTYLSCTRDEYVRRTLGCYYATGEGLITNAISDSRIGGAWRTFVVPVRDVIGN